MQLLWKEAALAETSSYCIMRKTGKGVLLCGLVIFPFPASLLRYAAHSSPLFTRFVLHPRRHPHTPMHNPTHTHIHTQCIFPPLLPWKSWNRWCTTAASPLQSSRPRTATKGPPRSAHILLFPSRAGCRCPKLAQGFGVSWEGGADSEEGITQGFSPRQQNRDCNLLHFGKAARTSLVWWWWKEEILATLYQPWARSFDKLKDNHFTPKASFSLLPPLWSILITLHTCSTLGCWKHFLKISVIREGLSCALWNHTQTTTATKPPSFK